MEIVNVGLRIATKRPLLRSDHTVARRMINGDEPNKKPPEQPGVLCWVCNVSVAVGDLFAFFLHLVALVLR